MTKTQIIVTETDRVRLSEESRIANALRAPDPDPGPDPREIRVSGALRNRATPQEMAEALEHEDPAKPGVRLATWALTGALATISPPVATSVAIISLAKGEDFRLATQALSVTGLLSMVGVSGAMAAVTAVLPY